MKKLLLPLLATIALLQADNNVTDINTFHKEPFWGVGMSLRVASVPYQTEERVVGSVVPLFYFHNDYIFMDGIEGGIKAYEDDRFRLSAVTKLRFIDIPFQYQNEFGGASGDFGAEFRYRFFGENYVYADVMSDRDFRTYADIKYKGFFEFGEFDIIPSAGVMFKSQEFNTNYYGLNREDVNADASVNAGLKMRYHVGSNFYVIGSAETTWLDNSAKNAEIISENRQNEFYAGISFFNEKEHQFKRDLKSKDFIRIAAGLGTPSDIGSVLKMQARNDEYRNKLLLASYGYALSDTLLTLPINVYLISNIVYHLPSEVQNSLLELSFGFKGYYTLPLPFSFRIGFAEGMSYISTPTYLETQDLTGNGYKTSNLMNYLDVSFDTEVGQFFNSKNEYWLGWGVYHRSSIFESAAQFGRIKGGSNYQMIFLETHL